VVVNHFKSKGSDCDDVGDPDANDGQGNCNLTRTKAATALVNWLASDPTGSGDPDFLIIGDLNAYAKEDPIDAIKNAGYINAGPQDYTYAYEGQSGTLDYVLASPSMFSQIRYANDIHVNADEPSAMDYNNYNQPGLYAPNVFRYADHDPMMIIINDWEVTQVGNELRIAYDSGSSSPQYAVLHLNDSYFRMNYGPTSGWGTSLVLMPAFWSEGVYYQGAPVSVDYKVVQDQLVLSISGNIHGLQVTLSVEISPPEANSLTAKVTANVVGSVPIDNRPGEAFKPVFLSSMHISDTQWDAKSANVDGTIWAIPEEGWLISPTPSLSASTFGLLGGSSDWKTNAPTVNIDMDLPIQVAGWVTLSSDPNDDNVGFWGASDRILSSWSYTVTVSDPHTVNLYLPMVRR